MFDRVFGKVEYDYGWCVPENIELFGKSYQITCVASAYKTEMISREQRTQYKRFKEYRKETLLSVEDCIRQYVQNNYPDYLDGLENHIVPKELIFHQNGETGVLFDCKWDIETGLVVGIFPQIAIINPDCFL